MPIPLAHRYRSIFHFTHIDNLPDILQTGFLCNNHDDFPQNGCRSIAEQGIQERRAQMEVSCGPGGLVHDYVPLYFGSLSPMLLAVVNRKNVDQMDILYFEFPIALVNRDDVVFTDASANTVLPPNFYADPSDLDQLNWGEIDSLKWKSANDTLRHQRMAEVLVHSHLPMTDAVRVVVWNEGTKQRVQKIVAKAGVPFPQIEFESPTRRHWFNKFMENSKASIVMGPREIAMHYKEACKEVADKSGQNEGAPFGTPSELLDALREDFGCLPHTAELIGLKSENGVHKQTVDVHTLEVVEKLKALPEFAELPTDCQRRVELAAFLHDIGKGPRSRWDSNGGLQKVDPDHPVRAMPMMVDILTNHVGKVKQTNAELILKLVCYHDLVGEVLGKGRDEQQIVDVADSKLELDMLFALGRADATSLVEWWWDEDEASALYDRCRATMKV
ncbi:MAG: DarT ssDNA thymidine ADP-ribosyltransferase family protein [Bryobacterales bacterium]|nr:DarT ssDNA thymidine ADP-ribosyltransferase family protein [Bryobacterales bacterium]